MATYTRNKADPPSVTSSTVGPPLGETPGLFSFFGSSFVVCRPFQKRLLSQLHIATLAKPAPMPTRVWKDQSLLVF